MDHAMDGSEARFEAYVKGLSEVIGHADRIEPLHDYCAGLLMPIKRKSVEPMAAVIAPARVSAKHQSLLHFVGKAPWSDAEVLAKVRELVLPSVTDRKRRFRHRRPVAFRLSRRCASLMVLWHHVAVRA